MEFEQSAFCPGILYNHPWKYELVLEIYKIQWFLSDLWNAQKKLWKSQKTEWKSLDTHQRVRCDLHSILFTLCGSPIFYHQIQNQRKPVRLFSLRFPSKKRAFFSVVLYKIGKKLIPWKMKKSWNSPGILFSHLCRNPESYSIPILDNPLSGGTFLGQLIRVY